MDYLLSPVKDIDDGEAVEWCQWLMAGGQSPDEFKRNVKKYNNIVACGWVYEQNQRAYRCVTCLAIQYYVVTRCDIYNCVTYCDMM